MIIGIRDLGLGIRNRESARAVPLRRAGTVVDGSEGSCQSPISNPQSRHHNGGAQ